MEVQRWRSQQTATKSIDDKLLTIEQSLTHLNYLINLYQGTLMDRIIWKLSGFPSVEELITERTRLTSKRDRMLKIKDERTV